MDNLNPAHKLNHIGIIGLGTIGSKLAVYLASRGIPVTACCHHKLEQHRLALETIITKKYGGDAQLAARITLTENLEELRGLPLVIDATREDYATKQDVYGRLKEVCTPSTILGSTTSSLDLHMLAGYYRVDSFFGFHVFNPPDKMQLIEIAAADSISPACRQMINALKSLLPDKVIIELPAIQGYVANRLLFLYLNSAYNFHLSSGIELEKIDQCMKFGTNVPMGPFLLSDYIGTDICLEILEQLYAGLGMAEYKPSSLLTELVAAGKLGRKTQQGFYPYA